MGCNHCAKVGAYVADVRVLKNLFSRARRKKKKTEVQSKLFHRENDPCHTNFEFALVHYKMSTCDYDYRLNVSRGIGLFVH